MATQVAAHSTPAAILPAPAPQASGLDDTQPRGRFAFIAITFAICVGGLATWLFVANLAIDGGTVLVTLTLAIATLIGERAPISLLGGNIFVSGEVITLTAAVIINPSIAPFVAFATVFLAPAPSTSVRLLGGSQMALTTLVTSVIITTASPPTTFAGHLLAASIASVTFVVLSAGQVALYERVVWHSSIRAQLPILGGSIVATTAFTLPIVAIVAYSVHAIGPISLPFLLVPLALVQYFNGLYQRKIQLTSELSEKAHILAKTNLQFAAAMVRALDTRDAYTAGHSAAVAVYTRDIAREMGFDDETVRMAHLAGLLHDIGKIGVPGRVLNKTAPLDDEEYELMKTHAAMGAEILGEVDLYRDIAVLVRYHHERIDGRGYPDGIAGDAIPAISRIISVADTYSAMTTDRPYREGMPTEKAMTILRDCRGTQLDVDFTDAFLRILIVADEAYQRGKQTEFEVEVAKHQALSEVEAEAIRVTGPAGEPEVKPASPVIPAATADGETIEVELEREAA